LGIGVACLDYLAFVDHYPIEDEKIRSTNLITRSGGNVLNCLSVLSLLGFSCKLVTLIGTDSNSIPLINQCSRLNINTHLSDLSTVVTPFSYIIVNKQKSTRTIIHTPGGDMKIDHLTNSCIEGIDLVYVDGRQDHASSIIAEWAYEKGLPIVYDLEGKGKYIQNYYKLLFYSNYVIVSSSFFLRENQKILEGIFSIFSHGNKAFVICTMGAQGSLLVKLIKKENKLFEMENIMVLKEEKELYEKISNKNLTKESWKNDSIEKFVFEKESQYYDIIYCAAFPLHQSEIIDTTGAGDVFIAICCAYLLKRLKCDDNVDNHYFELLRSSTLAASYKCTSNSLLDDPILNENLKKIVS